MGDDGEETTPWYLIISNIAKRNNIGNICRSASAFGVKEIFCVGRKKDVNFFGAHGSQAHVEFRFFASLADCVTHLKDLPMVPTSLAERGIKILGIEIKDDAQPVHVHPFDGPTAFLPGNEGDGLHPREMAVCDGFVYIPHYGGGTASLNVNVASAIIFHHFAMWAGYEERARSGHKFVVADRPQKHGAETDADMELRRQRAAGRDAGEDIEYNAETANAIFG